MLFFLTCVVQQLRQAVRTFQSSNVPEFERSVGLVVLQQTYSPKDESVGSCV